MSKCHLCLNPAYKIHRTKITDFATLCGVEQLDLLHFVVPDEGRRALHLVPVPWRENSNSTIEISSSRLIYQSPL